VNDANEDRLILGRALRALRLQTGLTQKEIATRAGTSEAYVSHAETGRLDVRWHTLRRLLSSLDANLCQLAEIIDQDDGQGTPKR
jgi:transcriptional regulator with XRE-family HTH domain